MIGTQLLDVEWVVKSSNGDNLPFNLLEYVAILAFGSYKMLLGNCMMKLLLLLLCS